MFTALVNGDPTRELYFQKFTDDFKLSKVILGAKSKIPDLKLKSILGNEAATVKCFKAGLDKTEFKVSREDILLNFCA